MLQKGISYDSSIIGLIIVNLIPIFGVLFLNWDLFTILILYWCESAVIGIFNILKMIFAKSDDKRLKFILIPFFAVHYGIFMFVHLMFILVITSFSPTLPELDFSNIFTAISQIFLGLVGLFASHGLSFYSNYIQTEEYKKSDASELMFSPYGRIIVMQFTIIIGTIITAIFGLPKYVILLFIFIKIIVDIKAHKKEHERFLIKKEL